MPPERRWEDWRSTDSRGRRPAQPAEDQAQGVCNYAMSLPDVDSELITLYDAEDVPDPLQLRRAAIAFKRAPSDIGLSAGQARLLQRTAEPAHPMVFHGVRPMVRCGAPRGPAGRLRRSTGWYLESLAGAGVARSRRLDEHNVTEDADLGVRLARYGYRTMILDSVTLEEANSDVINWIRQRSRWYKGYLQTQIVHMRRPNLLVRELGFKATARLDQHDRCDSAEQHRQHLSGRPC